MGFEYVEPRDVAEALAVLGAGAPGTHVVAGGTDLMLRVRLGQVSPRVVIGVGRLPELARIERAPDGGLRLGAAVTLAAIARSEEVRRAAPLLAEVCARTRSPQVRTLATVGGTLCAASPQAEPPIALLALGAAVELRGPAGARILPLEDFLVGPGQTAIRPGELLVGVRLGPKGGYRTGYERLCRREGIEAPLVAVAVALALDGAGACRDARVALGVATPRPVRLPEVEKALVGQRPDEELIRSAARAASKAELRDDVRASRQYRRRVAPVVVARALLRALAEGNS